MTTPALIGISAGVAVAIAAGGTAYVAKDAEPGDMLYDLRASLYGDVSGDGDVEAHMKGADDVYDEAERMEADGTLTAEERARLTAEYSAHVNAVAGRIAQLEAEGDAEAAADIRTSLRETIREYRDLFPTIEVNVGGSLDADADASVDSSVDDSASSAAAASSIFVQPSSSVTSA